MVPREKRRMTGLTKEQEKRQRRDAFARGGTAGMLRRRCQPPTFNAILAALIGFGAFAAVCGIRALDPSDLGWLTQGDPAQYLLGWSFFRNSPWTVPPGANPDYGLELASSVFFTDSIPLAALPFKALAWLAKIEQYFGWWLLLCFVLQGVCGWLLMGLAVRDAAARLLGAALLCFAPAFLWRLHGHYSLMAHWLVLLALWLALAPSNPRRWPLAWGGLLGVTALVHAYLLAMAAALWASDLARRGLAAPVAERRLPVLARLAAEALLLPWLVALCLWAGGFFVVRGGLSPGGFGTYAMNLLAPFDSDGQWSRFLPDLPDAPGREAGTNFLGLGLLCLLAAGAAAWLSRPRLLRPRRERVPLVLALAGLSAFALSHRIAAGGAEWLVLPLPARALEAANALRASERMFWPAYYALAVAGVALVVRRWGGRTSAVLLAVAVLAQVADGSAGWPPLRAKLDPPATDRAWNPLRGAFWDGAARFFNRVRVFPTANKVEGWPAVGRWAAINGLPTDMVYLARVDWDALAATRAAGERALQQGRTEPGTLYILHGSWAVSLAAQGMDPTADLLAEIDGFRVFAPGWKRRLAVPPGLRELRPDDVLPTAVLGTALRFGSDAPAADRGALLQGWSVPEPHGHWNDGTTAELALRPSAAQPGGPDEPLALWIRGAGFLPPQRPEQRVVVSVARSGAHGAECGEASAEWRFPGAEAARSKSWRSVAVPAACSGDGEGPRSGGLLRLRFRFPDAVRPRDLGLSTDSRALGFAIAELVLLGSGEKPP
jgi:hypothetical protein